MPHLVTIASEKPVHAPGLDLVALALDEVDFTAGRLPVDERRAFFERQYWLWCRFYAREACRGPSRAETELAIVLGISARIARLPR